MKGIHLAQVISAHPGTAKSTDADTPPYAGTVSVLLASQTMLAGTDDAPLLRVKVLRQRAYYNAGMYHLPEPEEWGLVAFYDNDPATGIWLGSLDNTLNNLIPEELWRKDPYAILEHYPSDRYAIHHGDGTEEHVWPDGSMLKLTARKDGQPGNPSERERKTPRRSRRGLSNGDNWKSERQAYQGQSQPPVDVVFKHSSGAEVRISADGSFWLSTAAGMQLRLFDDAEQGRDNNGNVTSPAGAGNAKGIYLETAGGVRLKLEDQGNKATLEAGEVVLAGGTLGGARQNDEIEVTALPGEITVQTLAGPASNVQPITLRGRITGASSKVKIG